MAASSFDSVLVLVCGLPAAGKTTLVKRLVNNGSTASRLYERISFDDIYEHAAANDEDREFDPDKWKASQQAMVLRVTERLEQQSATTREKETTQQLVLLVDDNFQYRSLRKRFFQLAVQRKKPVPAVHSTEESTVTNMSLVTCSGLRLCGAARERRDRTMPRTEQFSGNQRE